MNGKTSILCGKCMERKGKTNEKKQNRKKEVKNSI